MPSIRANSCSTDACIHNTHIVSVRVFFSNTVLLISIDDRSVLRIICVLSLANDKYFPRFINETTFFFFFIRISFTRTTAV